jgi:polygalacturonase
MTHSLARRACTDDQAAFFAPLSCLGGEDHPQLVSIDSSGNGTTDDRDRLKREVDSMHRTNTLRRGSLATIGAAWVLAAACGVEAAAPSPEERQLPLAMRSAMDVHPSVTAGPHDTDLVGTDHRVLQAAVDYVAGLGGGEVVIRAGQYRMGDSLHLRARVTVRGVPGKTVLRKADAVTQPLTLDGDYGEEQITLRDPDGFDVGCGIAIWDDRSGGFHTTVARIIGRKGNTLAIDRPLQADYMVAHQATAATVFPVVSGVRIEGARVMGLVIEGNRAANPHLNGCRGAGIYLYRGFATVIENCEVRNYNGDGISFQQSNDVTVSDCQSIDNAALGLHPGSGSQRCTVRRCIARGNGTDGLFLCWRVRHGLFEDNVLEDNGRCGISIGHKDSDNLLRRNQVRRNREVGVLFRNETLGMAAHRNRLVENVIEDNGGQASAAGIRVRGAANDLVFERNVIRDTRPAAARTQTIGIRIDAKVGPLKFDNNQIDAEVPIDDRRPVAGRKGNDSEGQSADGTS